MRGLGRIVTVGAVLMCMVASTMAETQEYKGRTMQRVNCSLPTPDDCVTAGGRRVDAVGIWVGDQLHWRYEDVSTPREPRAASTIVATRVIRSQVLRPAVPQDAAVGGGAGARPQGAFRADAFYNSWEGEFTEGQTYGVNPTLIFGDQVELAIRVPLYISEVEDVDQKMYSYGVDVTLQANLNENLKIGAHGNYVRSEIEDSDEDPDGYFNGGPFVSVLIPLGGMSLSTGCLVDYGVPEDSEDGDETIVVIPAANLGFPLSDSLAANVYGIYYYHTDSELSDYNYFDLGGDLIIALGETWNISVGGRTVVGLDHLDSIEGYVGTEWLF